MSKMGRRLPAVSEEWVFGEICLTRIGGLVRTQTRQVYEVCLGGFNPVWAENRSFLLLPWADFREENALLRRRVKDRLHGICVLAGDTERVYWTFRLLADGTVVVLDEEGVYYHVTPHPDTQRAVKHRLGTAVLPSEELYIDLKVQELEEEVRRVLDEQERKRQRQRERERKRRLKELSAAVPFQMGSGWGLRTAERLVVPPVYRQVLPPVGVYCAFEKYLGQWGVMALDGQVVVEPRFAQVTFCGRNRVKLTSVNGEVQEVKLA